MPASEQLLLNSAIKSLCNILSTYAFEDGEVKKIYEGLIYLSILNSDDLPILLIQTDSPLQIIRGSADTPANKLKLSQDLTIWYITNLKLDTLVSDTLRNAGVGIVSTIWKNNLSDGLYPQVDKILVNSIDNSDDNIINSFAAENDLDLVGVGVNITLIKTISDW